MTHLPFSVFRRKGRRFYYVQFKNKKGNYLSAISTKQTSEAGAIEIAFKWLREGKPVNGSTTSVFLQEIYQHIKTPAEVEIICKELERKGFLKSYVVTESKQAIDFGAFLQNFWDFDKSPYVREKLRKKHGIHKNYTSDQKLIAEKYWLPFFQHRFIGDITRQDIENFINDLADRKISAKQKSLDNKEVMEERYLSDGRKNKIIRAGIIPLRWAYAKEITKKDITRNITWFSEKSAERQILSPEIVQAIFRVDWDDERARLANMLAAVTGLRAGEIQGLRVQDLGKDCLYIRHSWNRTDKLKTTKNNENRTVELPFSFLINDLLVLAGHNPHGSSMDSYVFWAEKSPSKPMEGRLFCSGLREALIKTGMSKDSVNVYVFHGWRHFFTAYMRDKLNEKLLQSQTGHKSLSMLDHYAGHFIAGDREKIRQAQKDVFEALIPEQNKGMPLITAHSA